MKQQERLLLILAGVVLPLIAEVIVILYLKKATKTVLLCTLAFLLVVAVVIMAAMQQVDEPAPVAQAPPPAVPVTSPSPTPPHPPSPTPAPVPIKGAVTIPQAAAPSPGPGLATCPECGGAIVLRTNRSTGEFFYGCSRYPDCRGTRPFQGPNAAEAVTPEEARKRVGEVVTVRFKVAAARRSPKGAYVFCNDRPYHRGAAQAFTVVVDAEATGLDVKDLAGKVLTATGRVVEYQGRPEVKVTSRVAVRVE